MTYVSPRRWLPDGLPDAPDDGGSALLARWLHAYGPAAPEHFARWLGVPTHWAATLFAAFDLEPVNVDGLDLWQPPDEPVPDGTVRGVRLLPYFDAYVVASAPRGLLFPGEARTRALTRGQAGNRPVVLVDGVVAGIWHARTTRAVTHLTVELWSAVPARTAREVTTEAERVAAASGTRAEVTLGPVTVGPHA